MRYSMLVAAAAVAGAVAVKSNSHRHHKRHRAELEGLERYEENYRVAEASTTVRNIIDNPLYSVSHGQDTTTNTSEETNNSTESFFNIIHLSLLT
jgi:hypothetical protein